MPYAHSYKINCMKCMPFIYINTLKGLENNVPNFILGL